MWDDIPEKHEEDLEEDNAIGKSRYREDHCMRTIRKLIPYIELIEDRKYHAREEKREHGNDEFVEKVSFSIALLCHIYTKFEITYLSTILGFQGRERCSKLRDLRIYCNFLSLDILKIRADYRTIIDTILSIGDIFRE